MSEDLKTKFHRIVDEAWNKGNLDALDELHSADYIEHPAPFPDVEDLEAFRQMVAGTRNHLLEGLKILNIWKRSGMLNVISGVELIQSIQVALVPSLIYNAMEFGF